MDDAKIRERLDSAAKWLAGSFTTVTAILGGVGATTGGLERMLRNYREESRIAFGLIVISIGLAVISLSSFFGKSNRVARSLILVSAVAFAIGLYIATDRAVVTPSTRERPRVTAGFEVDENLTMNASVKAAGLRSTENVFVIVDGLKGEAREATRLYKSQSGPDPSGLVDIAIKIPMTVDAFDEVAISASFGKEEREKCLDGTVTEGCVIVRVPEGVTTVSPEETNSESQQSGQEEASGE